jgi:rhodanese-related sulfurtransferase
MKQLAVHQLAALCAGPAVPLLLDVREPWEFALAAIRIDGADTLHVPMNDVPARLAEIEALCSDAASTPRPIVCICHHGMRSAQVAVSLQRHGIEPVYNLAGGIDAWSAEVDAAVPRY